MNDLESTVPPALPPAKRPRLHRGYEIAERPASATVVNAGGLKTNFVVLTPGTGKVVWRTCQTLKQAKQMIDFELAQGEALADGTHR